MAQTSHAETPTRADQERAAHALAALKQGNLAEADISFLVLQKSVQAIPDLKKQFWITEDEKDKDLIAYALLRFGDRDPAWWDYLSEKAAEAVNSDVPSLQQFDATGKVLPEPSPEFLAWAKVHSLTQGEAEQRSQRWRRASAGRLRRSKSHPAAPARLTVAG